MHFYVEILHVAWQASKSKGQQNKVTTMVEVDPGTPPEEGAETMHRGPPPDDIDKGRDSFGSAGSRRDDGDEPLDDEHHHLPAHPSQRPTASDDDDENDDNGDDKEEEEEEAECRVCRGAAEEE
jgi:hypothetical protein